MEKDNSDRDIPEDAVVEAVPADELLAADLESTSDDDLHLSSGPSFPAIDEAPLSGVVGMRLPRPTERADFDRRPYPGMSPSYSDKGGHKLRSQHHHNARRIEADNRRRMRRTPDSGRF